MKKTWLLGGLAVLILAGPAPAQDAIVQGCEKFKTDIAKQKDVCAEENAEAAKITCKTKADLNATLKLFQKCGSKATSAATSRSSTGTASKDAGASKDAAAREFKCKAVDPADKKDIAEAAAPKMTECFSALKEKVKSERCQTGTAKVEYLSQSFIIGKWTSGTKATVTCK